MNMPGRRGQRSQHVVFSLGILVSLVKKTVASYLDLEDNLTRHVGLSDQSSHSGPGWKFAQHRPEEYDKISNLREIEKPLGQRRLREALVFRFS